MPSQSSRDNPGQLAGQTTLGCVAGQRLCNRLVPPDPPHPKPVCQSSRELSRQRLGTPEDWRELNSEIMAGIIDGMTPEERAAYFADEVMP